MLFLHYALDVDLKQSMCDGVGMNTHQADEMTEQQDRILWEKGILRTGNLEALFRTVFYTIASTLACEVALSTSI